MGKTLLPALSEFYANSHLETPEHSSSSSTGRKDAFHIGLRCSGTGQVLNKPCKSWRTSGMPAFKGINTEWPQLALQQCMMSSWEDTLTASHLVDDDIDTCTMDEARNLNFCRQWRSQELCVGGRPERFPSPSLEVGVSRPLKSSYGERCKLPQRVRAEPGRQSILGAFELKTALLVIASLKSIFMKQNVN